MVFSSKDLSRFMDGRQIKRFRSVYCQSQSSIPAASSLLLPVEYHCQQNAALMPSPTDLRFLYSYVRGNSGTRT